MEYLWIAETKQDILLHFGIWETVIAASTNQFLINHARKWWKNFSKLSRWCFQKKVQNAKKSSFLTFEKLQPPNDYTTVYKTEKNDFTARVASHIVFILWYKHINKNKENYM